MSHLIALHLLLLSATDQAREGVLRRVRSDDPEAGLSTLEIAVIALGLFLLAGVAVLALTTATNSRLNRIN